MNDQIFGNSDSPGVSSLPNEIWKDVVGYEGFYQVSNLGRVKRLKRLGNKKLGINSVTEKILESTPNGNGYNSTALFKKKFLTHRLVALSFLPCNDNELVVNHKNGIKNDNRLENLEWVTKSGNMNHAYQHCLKISEKGQNHSQR
jgi:hypothetical protein